MPLFKNEFTVGLVYSKSPDEFDVRFQMLCEKWDKNPKLQKFLQYFKVHKTDIFRYHLIKGVVDHCGIADIQDLFTTNSTESINYGKIKKMILIVSQTDMNNS